MESGEWGYAFNSRVNPLERCFCHRNLLAFVWKADGRIVEGGSDAVLASKRSARHESVHAPVVKTAGWIPEVEANC